MSANPTATGLDRALVTLAMKRQRHAAPRVVADELTAREEAEALRLFGATGER